MTISDLLKNGYICLTGIVIFVMERKRLIKFLSFILIILIVPILLPFVIGHVNLPWWAGAIYGIIILVNAAIFLLNHNWFIDKFLIQGKIWKYVGINVALIFIGLGIQFAATLFFESFPTGTSGKVSDVVDLTVRLAEGSLAIVIELVTILISVAIVLSDGWKLASFRYNEVMKDNEDLEKEKGDLEKKVSSLENEKASFQAKSAQPVTDSISVKVDLMMTKIKFDDINFIKSDGDYILINTVDGKRLMTLMTMKGIEKQLPFDKFCRVHRSYIVNMDKVSGIKEKKIVIDNEQIPLSDTCKASFFELLSHRSLVLKSQ